MQKIFLFVLALFSSAFLAANYDGLEQLIADMDIVGVQRFIDQVEDKAGLKQYFNRTEQPILEYFFSLPSMGEKAAEMLSVLLFYGADPNAFLINDDHYYHILSYAQKVDEILILLIYGADDTVHFSWEYTDALVNERYTHIVLYNVFRQFHFREKLARLKSYGRPLKNKEFKVIKEEFPLREIDELEKFMQSNRPFCEMPEKLKLFVEKYSVPVG